RAGHRPRERLRPAHPPEPGCEDGPARKIRRPEMAYARGRERLVRALEDSLGADVDPAPGGHLAVHRQSHRLEPAELVPRRPARNEERVRDQHAWCPRMRPKDADRLAALDEERLVLAQLEERTDDR